MYLKFYNFKKEPFHITPDPEFLFLSPSHREALGSIIYGIERKKGFVSITGAVGVGKTTILRSYLEKADRETIRAIYIFNPNLSFKNLLKTIHHELDIDIQTEDVSEMVNRLHYALIEQYRKGRNIVLVIDEAQNTPIVTLENLRMLSNLETSKEKLIQIVLIGQPEFEQMLKKHALRQINQRIAIRSVIQPLTARESRAYIEHRLSKAVSVKTDVFTSGALDRIIKAADGIPRTLNIICDNALITGFGSGKKPVTARIVKEVLADLNGGCEKNRTIPYWGRVAAGFLIAAAAGLYWMSPQWDIVKRNAAERAPAASVVESRSGDRSLKAAVHSLSAGTARPAKRYPITRIAERGDTLSSLARDVYGFCDQRILERIKASNPFIKNINMILAGHEILFPELDGRKR
jgi:general secretion pathway protein A